MLCLHDGGIIEERNVPSHHLLTEYAGILAAITINIEVDQALGAMCLA